MPQRKKTAEERKAAGLRSKPDAPNERVMQILPPEKPKDLKKDEALIWDRIVPILTEHHIVCHLDTALLVDYCVIRSAYETHQNYLRKHGWFLQLDNTGKKKPREEVKLIEKLEKQLDHLIEKLGLSPKARKSMHIVLIPTVAKNGIDKAKTSILKRR